MRQEDQLRLGKGRIKHRASFHWISVEINAYVVFSKLATRSYESADCCPTDATEKAGLVNQLQQLYLVSNTDYQKLVSIEERIPFS